MKSLNIILASLAMAGVASSCDDKLDVENPNNQTTESFGNNAGELNEAVIAAYNHMRMEGSYARVGYTIDLCRGDEVWNPGQVWYLPFDNYNVPSTDEITEWSWREWYYTINVTNFILMKVETAQLKEDEYKAIKGQALFIRGLAYYNLMGYYQNVPLMTDFKAYSDLGKLYAANSSQDEVLDLVESDLKEAMAILPSRDAGGQWAKGRATCGSAAGILAKALMFRQKYSEAYAVLKDIIGGKYGSYKLMDNYGDNFREGVAYENNAESIFEVQFLDFGKQGVDDEWTPVNTSPNATQGHAIESNLGPGAFGGWADLSASPWLYNLFKAERCQDGSLDPRLYWTIGTYEKEYDSYTDGRVNALWGNPVTDASNVVTNNNGGGIPIVKNTNGRNDIYNTIVTGLHCGVNLRLMRYAEVLLLAAECENEISGPTATALGYINQVRNRAGLANLNSADFTNADQLFEQIANVERPKELGCEFGRGFDLIRWGFFYDEGRLQQLAQHSAYQLGKALYTDQVDLTKAQNKEVVYKIDAATGEIMLDKEGNKIVDFSYNTTMNTYESGHEYLPVPTKMLNDNPSLVGNSANNSTSNAQSFFKKGYTVHPVVK